jgi:protein gp37
MEKRFHKGEEGKIIIHPERLKIPGHRRKRTVYAIWNDLAHEDVPEHFFKEAMEYINVCPEHIFLLLTKRPTRLKLLFEKMEGLPFNQTRVDEFECYWSDKLPLKNLWLGVTACNENEVWKIGELLKIPAAKRFLSIEPMLGPIEIDEYFPRYDHRPTYGYYRAFLKMQRIESDGKSVLINPGIDWVILGGETGLGARPMKLEWVRDVRDQCVSARVPFFFKAWGPRKEVGRILDGRTWDELPNI